ncbi:MAG: tRNA pseudouridine(38-40) synthase TruA [Chloroflexi bacterium]|nr:tRNA pseudouridine(38-40) synthase TruA [Chloroflexota bacterium]
MIVEYDGTLYHGFQWQANAPTIQDEIETAVEKLTGERLRVAAASRTDSGVHARGQVVSLRTASPYSLQTFVKGLNFYLPCDIAVKAAYRANDSFDVRKGAIGREYEYHILNSSTRSPLNESFCYRVERRLDVPEMNRACEWLVGEHDLASFASDLGMPLKSTVRKIFRAGFTRKGDMIVFDMAASSFLPHQVRNTVGAMVRVGQGKLSPSDFYRIIKAKRIGLAGPTAPAKGLCLMRVNYSEPFEEEEE